MKTTQTIPRLSALIIAAVLATIALTPTDAAAEEVSVMRHSTPPLPGYGVLALEIWTDGTDVQVIGLDAQGRIVLARDPLAHPQLATLYHPKIVRLVRRMPDMHGRLNLPAPAG